MEAAVSCLDVDQFLDKLRISDQKEYKSTISPLDEDNIKCRWISENADLHEWRSGRSSPFLWLTGPVEAEILRIASGMVDQERNRLRLPLYFFCETLSEQELGFLIVTIVHTLLEQYIRSTASQETRKRLVEVFVRSLIKASLSRFPNSPSFTSFRIEALLDGAKSDELWEALCQAIAYDRKVQISIILHGPDGCSRQTDDFQIGIVSFLPRLKYLSPNLRAVVTGRPSTQNWESMSSRFMHIEYDKERRGGLFVFAPPCIFVIPDY
jgi:hypothetical protein